MPELLLPAGHRNILLSPHHDDVAFCLGCAVRPGDALVNLFTASAHIAGQQLPMWPDPARVQVVTAIRTAEDAAFAARMGLERRDLGLPEPALLGREFRDPRGIADDVARLCGPLLAMLDELAVGRVNLLCPAGFGGHANHLATRAVVIAALPRLEARGVRVLFYEDLPYASRWRLRRAGIAGLKRALPGRRLRRRAQRVDPAEKLALLRLYPSQHGERLDGLQRFSPAAIWPPGLHEAAWELLPA